MERSERLEVITTLAEAGKSDEEILNYLQNDLSLELAASTLKKDIKEVRDSLNTEQPENQPEQDNAPEPDAEEDAPEESEEESEEADQPEDPQAKKAEEEEVISFMRDKLKEGTEEAELLEDFEQKHGKDAQRLLQVAHARNRMERNEKKIQEAKADREKFIGTLKKNVSPAIDHLTAAISEIEKAKSVKRKAGRSTSSFSAVEKTLNRQVKRLERQING